VLRVYNVTKYIPRLPNKGKKTHTEYKQYYARQVLTLCPVSLHREHACSFLGRLVSTATSSADFILSWACLAGSQQSEANTVGQLQFEEQGLLYLKAWLHQRTHWPNDCSYNKDCTGIYETHPYALQLRLHGCMVISLCRKDGMCIVFHPHLQHAKMLHKLLERGKHQSFVHPEVLTSWRGSIREKRQETKQKSYGWVIPFMAELFSLWL